MTKVIRIRKCIQHTFCSLAEMEQNLAIGGCTVAAITSGLAVWALYKWCALRRSIASKEQQASTASVQQQLVHHYVNLDQLEHLKGVIPASADEYHSRLAQFCADMSNEYGSHMMTVLDIGSGVGATSFHLSKHFSDVVAVDKNIDMTMACKQLQIHSEYTAPLTIEGGENIKLYQFKIPDDCRQERILFLNEDLASILDGPSVFNCIVMSNVLTELDSPTELLEALRHKVATAGLLIIADPFLWKNGPEGSLRDYSLCKPGTFMHGSESELNCDNPSNAIVYLHKVLYPTWQFRERVSMPFYEAQSERVARVASVEVSVWQITL